MIITAIGEYISVKYGEFQRFAHYLDGAFDSFIGAELRSRNQIPSQFIDGHRSPMGPIDGYQWSIDGHR